MAERNHWLKLWHEMPNDPKWRTVARVSGQPISLVIALYVHLLVQASEAGQQGEVEPDEETLASALDCSEESVRAVLEAMNGRVIANGCLRGWMERQSNPSTERSKLHRSLQRAATQCNAEGRDATHATTEEKRREERREEEKQEHFARVPEASLELVYAAYPRHVGKPKALAAIQAAAARVVKRRGGPPLCSVPDALVHLRERAQTFAHSPAGQAGEFTPHPATWFNQARYDDDEMEWQRGGNGNGAHRSGDQTQRVSPAAQRRSDSHNGVAAALAARLGHSTGGDDDPDAGSSAEPGFAGGHGSDVARGVGGTGTAVRGGVFQGRTLESTA